MEQTLIELIAQVGVNALVLLLIIRAMSNAFSTQINSLTEAHRGQMSVSSEQIHLLSIANEKQDDRILKLEESRRETDKTLALALVRNAELKAQVVKQDDDIKQLKLRIEEQVVSISELKTDLKEARQGAGVSDKESDDYKVENAKLTATIVTLEKQVAELQRDNRVIRNEPPPIKDEGDKEAG